MLNSPKWGAASGRQPGRAVCPQAHLELSRARLSNSVVGALQAVIRPSHQLRTCVGQSKCCMPYACAWWIADTFACIHDGALSCKSAGDQLTVSTIRCTFIGTYGLCLFKTQHPQHLLNAHAVTATCSLHSARLDV